MIGYVAVFNDGSTVVAEFGQPRLWWEGRSLEQFEPFLYVRGVQAHGFHYAVAHGHDSGQAVLFRLEDNQRFPLGPAAGNQPVALRTTSAGVEAQFTQEVNGLITKWTGIEVDPDLHQIGIRSGSMPNTSQGIEIATDAGPVWMQVFSDVGGYVGGFAEHRGGRVIAQAADAKLADMSLLVKDGETLGTLDAREWYNPHLSEDGSHYCAWSHTVDPISGPIPSPLPPLVGPTMPDVGRVSPAHAGAVIGAFVLNNAPLSEPDPHLPFGVFSLPVRLSNLPAGALIVGPTDPILSTPDRDRVIAIWAGEDNSINLSAEQAVADARPAAVALGVGLLIYQDSTPMRESVVALRQPGDVLAPFVRTSDDLRTLSTLPAPLCPSVELQRLTPADGAELVIALSQVPTFGAIIFAKDRTDVRWDALEPYLTRYLSGATSPAAWPRPTPSPDPTPDPDPNPTPEPPPMPSTPSSIQLRAENGMFVRTNSDNTLSATSTQDFDAAKFDYVLLEGKWSNGAPIALRQNGQYVCMHIQDLIDPTRHNVQRVFMGNHESEMMTVWNIRRGVGDGGGWGFEFPSIGQIAADGTAVSCHANPNGIDGPMRFHIFDDKGAEIVDDFEVGGPHGAAPALHIQGADFVEGDA